MHLKPILIFLTLFLFNVLAMGQEQTINYPKAKIRVGAGLSYNNFYGEQPFTLVTCFEGCPPLNQASKPSFTIGSTLIFMVKPRHYLGFGYRWHQIKIEQELLDLFGRNTFRYNTSLNYHSLSFIHQFQILPSKKYWWWSNAIGTDLNFNKNALVKQWPLFYRTSLSFPLRIINKRGPAIAPFFQIALTSYTSKQFEDQALMRPFMIGLMVNIPYDVYKKG